MRPASFLTMIVIAIVAMFIFAAIPVQAQGQRPPPRQHPGGNHGNSNQGHPPQANGGQHNPGQHPNGHVNSSPGPGPRGQFGPGLEHGSHGYVGGRGYSMPQQHFNNFDRPNFRPWRSQQFQWGGGGIQLRSEHSYLNVGPYGTYGGVYGYRGESSVQFDFPRYPPHQPLFNPYDGYQPDERMAVEEHVYVPADPPSRGPFFLRLAQNPRTGETVSVMIHEGDSLFWVDNGSWATLYVRDPGGGTMPAPTTP